MSFCLGCMTTKVKGQRFSFERDSDGRGGENHEAEFDLTSIRMNFLQICLSLMLCAKRS